MKWLYGGILAACIVVPGLAAVRAARLVTMDLTDWLAVSGAVVLVLAWHPIRNMRPPHKRAWYIQALWLSFFHCGPDRNAAARRMNPMKNGDC